MNNNKILILGATGRTGKHLLSLALARGYEVNILVRDIRKIEIQSDRLKVFEGTPSDLTVLASAIENCSIVISALNISRKSDFPWAKLHTPKDFIEKSIQNILCLSNQYPIKSLIVISAWGVSETRNDIPWWFRLMIDYSNIKFGYEAHEQQEKLIKSSNLNWTIVRPVVLTNFTKQHKVHISLNSISKPSLFISRKNVASFMLDILETKTFIHQILTISE
ncbi:NAD(P)H-binding protein [Arcicella aquatica]|uniref:NAD(P)H-binding protein n=1 Tax=Arcicella aquatica TaxID=217141 RepID=A0ABU5QRA8_9BACT|nr:NAD(P)H-binding protein [Arcicella aquatica]MEA5259616.1 NAD(P)H-binding protein [Arcicella aquatica]